MQAENTVSYQNNKRIDVVPRPVFMLWQGYFFLVEW